MVLCVLNVARFPLFLSSSGDKILGSSPPASLLTSLQREYITSLIEMLSSKKQVSIIVLEMQALKLRRRFLINNEAFNPVTRKRHFLVRKQFVFPSTEVEQLPSNCLAIGMELSVRNGVFLPLAIVRKFTSDELRVLKTVTTIKEINSDQLISILEQLNVEVVQHHPVSSTDLMLKIHDRELQQQYWVFVDERFIVKDANICVEFFSDLTLVELIFLVREQGHVFLFEENAFHWIPG